MLFVGVVDATMLALAGLLRLGMKDVIGDSYTVGWDEMLPAVAQGAIGIQCRSDDSTALRYLAALNHPATKLAVDCERAFLARLDGNCRTPIAGQAYFKENSNRLVFKGMLSKPDGKNMIVVNREADVSTVEEAVNLGTAAGNDVREKAGERFDEYQHAMIAVTQSAE